MLFFVDNNGTVINNQPSPVYQGGAGTNNIILVAPFASNLQFAVAFTLPNGANTETYMMSQGGEINGVQYAPTKAAMSIWTFSMPSEITALHGQVYAQFYTYGTNGQITPTSRVSFNVGAGVEVELPAEPTQDIYNQILTALSQYSSQLNSGAYPARSIYWWINSFTYGMNEITYYPVGTYGALIKSVVANNTNNQPYNAEGVLNSQYWEEIANLNSVFDEAVNAQGSAAKAAASATQAAQSASAASAASASAQGYATQASQSATAAANSSQTATTQANNSAVSAAAAAKSEANAMTYAQQAQEYSQKHYAIVASYDDLPRPGNSAYIYLVPLNNATEADSYSEYLWISEQNDYELIGNTSDINLADYATTAALSAETAARIHSDNTLKDAITAETNARTSADTNLQKQITNIENGTTVVGAAEVANRTGSIVIQNNADLNDYTANRNEMQVYTCQTNATAATLLNCPVDVTFTMWTTRAFEDKSNGSRDFQF